jgi:hypothetical protein
MAQTKGKRVARGRRGVLESTTNFIEKPFTYAALATSVRRTLDAT